MKNINLKLRTVMAAVALAILCATVSCKEDTIGQTPSDSTPPAKVKNVRAVSIPGGAQITYDLPDDPDMLYVKAVWTVNGVEKNNTASLNTRTLEIKGFGSTDPQEILLYSVDRSQNVSEPESVTITPDTPPVTTIFESIEVTPAFGGIRITWSNPTGEDLTITVTANDTLSAEGEMKEVDVVYTSLRDGVYSVRGLEPKKRVFGVMVRDRWDNMSPVKTIEETPLYEEKLNKQLWSREELPGDNLSARQSGSGGRWLELYDDNIGLTSYNWWYANEPKYPMLFTLDLGVNAKLSRHALWHYMMNNGNTYTYGQHLNVKRWKLYGAAEYSASTDEAYWTAEEEGTGWKADWTLLAECVTLKPSGMDNSAVTQEDADFAVQGFQFDCALDAPPVRYVRFHITETWQNSYEIIIGELTFWGQVQSNN
ncbi:MAG: DUF4959 domain-containing protein [Prevotellaceae bacterium]|nr:DUF4959 domain-containing protein [Prevotellaceae bacterium]